MVHQNCELRYEQILCTKLRSMNGISNNIVLHKLSKENLEGKYTMKVVLKFWSQNVYRFINLERKVTAIQICLRRSSKFTCIRNLNFFVSL
jgi:hypothetical protein